MKSVCVCDQLELAQICAELIYTQNFKSKENEDYRHDLTPKA